MDTNTTGAIPQGSAVKFVPEGSQPIAINVEQKTSAVEITGGQVSAPTKETNWKEKIEAARAQQAAEEVKATVSEEKLEAVQAPETKDTPEVKHEEVAGSQSPTPDLNTVLNNTEADGVAADDSTTPEEEPEEPKNYKVNDDEPLMDVPVGNLVGDVPRLTQKFNPTGDPEVIRERLMKDPYDFYVRIMQLFSTVGTSVDLARDYLEKLYGEGHTLKKNPENLQDELTRSTVKPGSTEKQKLTGRDAKLAVLARAKGLRKIHLLNSGFWVVIRPPRIAELSQWYNEVSMEVKDFGRLLGGHVFMFSDVLLKMKFMEVFPSLVVDSNLENWRAPDRFAKMISIQDFDTIIWGCCTLIYKEAISVNVHCTNEDCQYVAENYNVDIDKLRLNNLDAIPAEALDYLSKQLVSTEKVSTDMIRKYFKVLGFNRDLQIGDVTYKLHVPSISKFIQCGSEFVKMVMESVKGISSDLDNNIDREIRVNVVKTYLPWISKIVTPEFETDDQDAIIAQLEQDAQRDRTLADAMLKYQYDTKLSYFCYTLLECPVCHKTPSDILKDYYPLDPTYLFFFLFSRQLSQMIS